MKNLNGAEIPGKYSQHWKELGKLMCIRQSSAHQRTFLQPQHERGTEEGVLGGDYAQESMMTPCPRSVFQYASSLSMELASSYGTDQCMTVTVSLVHFPENLT